MLCDSCRTVFCICKGSSSSRCRYMYSNLEPPATSPIWLLEKLQPHSYGAPPNHGLLIFKAQWRDNTPGSDKRGTSFIYSNAPVLERGSAEEGDRLEKAVYDCLTSNEWARFTTEREYVDFLVAGGITLPALLPQDDTTESELEVVHQATSSELSLAALPLVCAEKAPAAMQDSGVSGIATSRPPKRPRTGVRLRTTVQAPAVSSGPAAIAAEARPTPEPTPADLTTLN